MRTMLRSKVTLLFVTFAVLLAVGGTALALTTDLSGITDPSGTSGTTSPPPTIVSSQADFTTDTSGTTDPSGSTSPAPTIQSDKADYPPGATVTLTGSNWQPGESVHIYVNDNDGQTWNRDVDVTADANGNITDQFNLPDWFVATYNVTAAGAQSGVATSSFTDGNVTLHPGPTTDGVTQYRVTYDVWNGTSTIHYLWWCGAYIAEPELI